MFADEKGNSVTATYVDGVVTGFNKRTAMLHFTAWMMFWEHITLSERQKASRIIADLRRDYTCRQVANMFNIQRVYVSFADKMHKRRSGGHMCPAWAIGRIIAMGALMGSRRLAKSPFVNQEQILEEQKTPHKQP